MFDTNANTCKTNLSVSDFSKLLCQSKLTSNYLILHMNVRSLNKNINIIDELLGLISCFPEIIVISETKLTKTKHNVAYIENYYFQSIDSSTSSGDIGIYLHTSLNYKFRPDLRLNVELFEDIWIEINPNSCRKAYIIEGIYFHSHTTITNFQDKLELVIDKINQEGV